MVRVRRCRIGVVLAVLSLVTTTACTGPDQFAPAPTLLEASAAHPLAAPPIVAASASVSRPAEPTATGPAPIAGGGAAPPAGWPSAPRTASAPTRTSLPVTAPRSTPATGGLSVSPSVSVSPSRQPRRERPGWIQSLMQGTDGVMCDEKPVSERNDDRAFTVQRLEAKEVCFSGLAEKPAPELVLSAPGGGQIGIRAESDSGFSYHGGIWGWSFEPGLIGDALSGFGTYHFELTGIPDATVRRGATMTLSGRITVVPGSEPRISFTYHPESEFNERAIRAGGEVAVQFAGYRPGSRHFLTVYAPDEVESGFKALEDLPEVVIPSTGEATIYWKSAATAVPGHYGIWVQSTPVQPGGCNVELCEFFEIEE
jgi:hypothetical protein